MKLPETDDFVVDLRSRDKQEKSEKIPNTNPPAGGQIPATGMWHFVQYNNAFLIILVICVLAFGSLSFASEEVRDATIGGKTVYAEGTDNTLLLEQDFDKFNMDFKIIAILEDEDSYTVSYSFVDFDLVTNSQDSQIATNKLTNNHPEGQQTAYGAGELGVVWQFVEKQGARKIDKPFRQDLGLYLAEQLRQEASARIKELKRLQREEREKGLTKIVQVTEYSGLIGKILDLSTAVFPGYEPVKKVELETPLADEQIVQRATSGGTDNLANVYNNWIEEHPSAVADLNAGETVATTTAPVEVVPETPAPPNEPAETDAPSADIVKPVETPAENSGTATNSVEAPAGQ